MTAKKDLKRRVRDRQVQTGESYVTARKRVVAGRPVGPGVEVIEMIDVTAVAAPLGVTCRVVVSPALAKRVEPLRLLVELVKVLDATDGDRLLAVLRAAIREGGRPRSEEPSRELVDALAFVRRARAGLGGVGGAGRWLALRVADVMVLYRLQLFPSYPAGREPLLLVAGLDELELTAGPMAKVRP